MSDPQTVNQIIQVLTGVYVKFYICCIFHSELLFVIHFCSIPRTTLTRIYLITEMSILRHIYSVRLLRIYAKGPLLILYIGIR